MSQPVSALSHASFSDEALLPPLSGLLNLDGKRAIVSGGASGIGLAVSQLLAEIGMYVEILDIKAPPASSNPALSSRIVAHTLDVTDREQCNSIARSIIERCGKITTLINAAGIVLPDSEQGPSNSLSRLLNCNVLGTAHLCEAFQDYFEDQGGTIVNIGSIVGTLGWPKRAAYCASKGAVEAMSRALALEYAPRNIRVNVVAPGIVATPLMHALIMNQAEPYRAYQERAQLQVNKRLLTPREVATTVLYLASDLSSGVIGATIDLSAGRLAGHVSPQAVPGPENTSSDSAWLSFSAGEIL